MHATLTQSQPHIGPIVPSASKGRLWAGRILTGLPVAFLLFDTVIKLLQLPLVEDSFRELGYPSGLALTIGTVELVCLLLYVIPRTSVLGAIVTTGYLGGAIATHVRLLSPLPTHTLFPIYVALLLWGGLYLREPRLRALLPFRE